MKLTNKELNEKLIGLSAQERLIVSEILKHLKEVERRRLYAEMAYSSLFDYCVRELKMSEAAASRKISAMRLLKEVPQIEKKVEEGKLNLTTLSMAKSFFNKKEHTKAQKLKLLNKLEGKSSREVEKTLVSLVPASSQVKASSRQISEELTRLNLTINKEQNKKMQRLKELKGLNEIDLLDWLMDRALKEIDPVQKNTRTTKANTNKRHIPASLKKALHIRDKGRCQYIDPITGKQCECRTKLQVDHILPYARGGPTEINNLRLLCPEHNRLLAIQNFGKNKMKGYLRC